MPTLKPSNTCDRDGVLVDRLVRTDFGMRADDLLFEDGVLRRIDIVVEEAGVRGLKKAIRDIAVSINLKRIMKDTPLPAGPHDRHAGHGRRFRQAGET